MINNLAKIMGEENFEIFQKEILNLLIQSFERDLDEWLQSNYIFDFDSMFLEIEDEMKSNLKAKLIPILQKKQDEMIKKMLEKFE